MLVHCLLPFWGSEKLVILLLDVSNFLSVFRDLFSSHARIIFFVSTVNLSYVSWNLLVISNIEVRPGQQVRTFTEAVEQYSQLGLRTLCLAWRELEDDEYQEWAMMFNEANSTLVDREVPLEVGFFGFLHPFLELLYPLFTIFFCMAPVIFHTIDTSFLYFSVEGS